jgi:hypothetical protein
MRGGPAGDAANRRVLLVEGPDDRHAFDHLLGHHGIAGQFDVEQSGGADAVLTSLRTRLKFKRLETLGIVLDTDPTEADPNAVAHLWLRVGNALQRAGYRSTPEMPVPEGTIIREAGKPVVGIWLMPDNTVPGMLEDFCRFLIPDGDPLWNQAVQAVQAIPDTERRFPVRHMAKANLHTWLAWQEEPGKPIGQAITKKYLDADAPPALKLIAWLHSLFGVPAV